jgi:hypothetical protein
MRAEGIDAPVYLVRVGYDYYVRKGSRRRRPPSSDILTGMPEPARANQFVNLRLS